MNFSYKGTDMRPTQASIVKAADMLGCNVAALEAVIAVEAAGKFYNSNRTMVRRFEPHHLPQALQRELGFSGGWRASLRLATTSRRRMFDQAYAVDPEAACYAASWGAFQIMGFNATRAGFRSSVAMVSAFEKDVSYQLSAFIKFVEFIGADSDLRAQNWVGFARKYNGSGQPQVYARRMETEYARRTGGGSPSVLRVGNRGQGVTELQRALQSRGYAVEPDGHFGSETLEGVRKYQADNGLTVDGHVGSRTWQTLRAEAVYNPVPEVEPTAGETLIERASVASGVMTAGGGAVHTLMGQDASDSTRQVLIIAVAVLAIVAVGAYMFKSRSKSKRAQVYAGG